jgi:hypothetical protein
VIKHSSTEIVPLTKTLATDFATMPAWRGERPLSERRLTYLLNELVSEHFFTPRWAVAKLGDKTIRVNGQHSSTMLARLDDFPESMTAIVDTYVVEDEADLGGLFTKFDNPESTRRTREALAALLPEELGKLSRTTAERIAAGMFYGITRFEAGSARGVHVLGAAVQASPSFAFWVQEHAKSRGLGRTAVIAAAFMTWKVDPASCKEFWALVDSEDDPLPNHPTRALARAIRESDRGRGSVQSMKALCAKSILAWNFWRRDQKVQKLIYRGHLPEAE